MAKCPNLLEVFKWPLSEVAQYLPFHLPLLLFLLGLLFLPGPPMLLEFLFEFLG